MVLSKIDGEKIIKFVKKEPCLVQDIARHINRNWVTTDSYVEKIAKETGLIRTKAFRKGTKGAVKIVFWNYAESAQSDEVKARIFEKIKLTKNKKEFDPLEIFQFVDDKKSRAFLKYKDAKVVQKKNQLIPLLEQADEELMSFSGNISWINTVEKGTRIIDAVEKLLERGVLVKILCRADIASLNNLNKIDRLAKKYPSQIEIRHCCQPVRGLVVDSKVAWLKDEKSSADFKERELEKDLDIVYEIRDPEWIDWLKKTFWYLFRTSVSHEDRLKVLDKVIG